MDSNLLVGRIFESQTVGTKDEDGYWKVILSCTEKRTTDLVDWESGKIEFMGIDRDFGAAHKTALTAYLMWMNDYVYGHSTDSILEGMKIQETENAKPVLNKTTTT